MSVIFSLVKTITEEMTGEGLVRRSVSETELCLYCTFNDSDTWLCRLVFSHNLFQKRIVICYGKYKYYRIYEYPVIYL